MRERARHWVRRHCAGVYLGSIGALTAVLMVAVVWAAARAGAGPLALSLLAVFAILPASELAVQITNYMGMQLMPPHFLPRMSFERVIPDDCRTLVVIPMMLLSPESIREEAERLRTRYLANPDPNLLFGLVSDFADAPLEEMPEDVERLDAAEHLVVQLDAEYGPGRFFLFHRRRRWSDGEGRWIGWERKRGKLEHLNRFLMGDHAVDGMLRVGEAEKLQGVRFVITLDSDTQLPRDTARRLVETLAHPLNRPHVSADGRRIERGYAIIQPRVSSSLPSATSTWFSRVFADTTGIDPYTQAVSDIYQDLSGEATYHGKGIHYLDAFHRLLSARLPENLVLSHDLLEGAHLRVGLATDIELLDQFPQDYVAYSGRRHRRTRGDWQIWDWTLPRVPARRHPSPERLATGRADSEPAAAAGREANPLSILSRWKIADNLRRSTVPVSSLALLAVGWAMPPSSATVSAFVASVLLLPALAPVLWQIASHPATHAAGSRELWIGVLRALIAAALLPQQSAAALDAICRALYRRALSHRLLLEWETSEPAAALLIAPSSGSSALRDRRKRFVARMAWAPVCALVAAYAIAGYAPEAAPAAMPFLALWALSPGLAAWLSAGSRARLHRDLSDGERRMLRQVARKTWRYFADLVGPETNWLPPDNYQDDLRIEVAQRTSPTNIGFGLLSTLAAHDLGYIGCDAAVARTGAMVDTLTRLERYEGHLYNWYHIGNLAPLEPRYVSMVDSGNLLAGHWALEQGLRELLSGPVVGEQALRGLADTLDLVWTDRSRSAPAGSRARAALGVLRRLATATSPTLETLANHIRESVAPANALVEDIAERCANDATLRPPGRVSHDVPLQPPGRVAAASRCAAVGGPACLYWAAQVKAEVTAWSETLDRYLGWTGVLGSPPGGLTALGADAHMQRREALRAVPSLRDLAAGNVAGLASLVALQERRQPLTPHSSPLSPVSEWLERLSQAMYSAQEAARERVAAIEDLISRVRTLCSEVNMRFLYDEERRQFSTDYNVSDLRMDVGHCDLLASEARLGSFVAIARGEAPPEHWWALGRPYGSACGASTLLSWNGSMFEYLMPLLLMRTFDHSLLDKACRDAVACQMSYGHRRRVPWGISEAAFSALDSRQTYQYRAFGVPGLGIKRGLQDDLVVAPYATALALCVDAPAAVRNLRALSSLAGLKMLSDYGYYDALDYSRRPRPDVARGVVVRTYMAHHQGMILSAIDNALNDGILRDGFHRDPRVRATESLLYERIPALPAVAADRASDEPVPRPVSADAAPKAVRIETPETPTPRTDLLSNGRNSVMVTNAGGGRSTWRNAAVTRWRADTTRDAYGGFIYLRDEDTGAVWSARHHPTGVAPQRRSIAFQGDKAEFRRTDAGIETVTRIAVSPEDDVEVRHITLMNRTLRRRRVEVTSYVELALATHNADRAHPAFSKLFVQTEALPAHHGLIAWRRTRSDDETPIWALHVVSSGPNQPVGPLLAADYETDRARFIGRGRTLARPLALDGELSGTTGAVLDPAFSLRRSVTIGAGECVEIAFVTSACGSRDEAVALTDKYGDVAAVRRALEMAWTHSELELRRLGIRQEEAHRFQQLAAHVLYPNPFLRAPADRLARNTMGQAGLWAYGLSGDLPIVVVTIADGQDMQVVREVLLAHAYWRARGIAADLVLLAEQEEGTTYEQPLKDSLRRIVEAERTFIGSDQPGGMFMIPGAGMSEEDRNVLLSSARVVIVAARGPLDRQLAAPASHASHPSHPSHASYPLPASRRQPEELPFMELRLFNGLGGFTDDGKECVIYLPDGTETPLPWVNVLSNPSFGAIVSESGAGPTWFGNSQGARLTPWSNDPVCDPISDALYIRDEATRAYWSPTPRPVRDQDPYRARHGQGYTVYEHNSHGIEQELTILVRMDSGGSRSAGVPPATGGDPVRLHRLRLRNRSSVRRRLTVYSYCEWVLGVDHEETRMYVTTDWEQHDELLLARNPGRPDYGERVAFVAASLPVKSHTGDRSEFLGRNGSAGAPAALRRTHLSGSVGAGLDPCAPLQLVVELDPHQETEILFLLGQGSDTEEVRSLARRYRQPGAFDDALAATRSSWDDILDTVQVETPDRPADILLNRWLLYQTLSCRVWGRSAFYQSGGAYGFRDQLQDVMALVHAAPWVAREHIVRSAARQFVEGDVQHWWHAESGAGVRTRISDDLLWLPYAAAHYVRATGDRAILDEVIPFLEGRALEPEETDALFVPGVSAQQASLLEHCRRAVAHGTTEGPNGLPLIGAGDWSDGLNRVGTGGKGESVWLAWFLIHVMHDLAEMLELSGESEEARGKRQEAIALRARAARLAAAVEEHCWDGAWYLRATFDDGTPIGSARNSEARIDTIAQSWAVICGRADPARSAMAMGAVQEHLVRADEGMVLLFDPPFEHTTPNPGYIMSYPPGVRENGGQYTHGSLWAPLALARLGDGDGAASLLRMMNPLSHSAAPDDVGRYMVEPYVAAADVYNLPGRVGRGGWTWYTGSASLMYRVWIEEIPGFRRSGGDLTIEPTIPESWGGFAIRYRHGRTMCRMQVENPDHVGHGVSAITLDGEPVIGPTVRMRDDGGVHVVVVTLGSVRPLPAAARP